MLSCRYAGTRVAALCLHRLCQFPALSIRPTRKPARQSITRMGDAGLTRRTYAVGGPRKKGGAMRPVMLLLRLYLALGAILLSPVAFADCIELVRGNSDMHF